MTVAQKIRKAALGPVPRDAEWLYSWMGGIGTPAHLAVRYYSDWVSRGVSKFTGSPRTIQRMFLLFVAEALESE